MKIIYSCYGGAHTSIVTAAIHLGLLPLDHIPKAEMIATVPYYDQSETKDLGTPIFMGIDEWENEIYVIGMGPFRKEGTELVLQFTNEVHGNCRGKALMVNSIALINLPIRIGGLLSRKLKLVSIGKPITIFGIQKKYYSYVSLVNNVKQTVYWQS